MAESKVDKAVQQLLKLGIEVKTLWQNASPSSAFPAQEITVNGINKCRFIDIEMLQSTTNHERCIHRIDLSSLTGGLDYIARTLNVTQLPQNNELYVYGRSAQIWPGENKIKFNAGYWHATWEKGFRGDNAKAIPLKIVGYYLIGGGYCLKRLLTALKRFLQGGVCYGNQ